MVRASPMQTNFTGGELSPLLRGHINLDKYAESCRTLQNMVVLKQGPVTRRGGTIFTKEVGDVQIVPFEYSTEQAYLVEVGDLYMRFIKNRAPIKLTAQNITNITQASPAVVTYSGTDTYANGDEVYISGVAGMTEVNGRYFIVASVNAGANTFELTDVLGNGIDSTSYTAYSSGGTVEEVYTITSPYPEASLTNSETGLRGFQTGQSADVIYFAHGSYKPYALTRSADTSWTMTAITFNDGPYLDTNVTTTTLTLSGTTGSVTVTASAITGINNDTGFQTTDVGRLIRWKDPANNWTWLEITARASTTSITATIRGANASAGTATVNWRLGAYSDTTGWPSVVGFHQNRLLLASSTTYPDRYDLSRSGGYSPTTFYYAPSAANGTVADDDAIYNTLPSGEVNNIQWAHSDERGLILGTTAKEWIIRPSDTGGKLTPSNQEAVPLSSVGSAYIAPISADAGVLFAQRARRRVHDMVYSLESDRLKPRDLNTLADHITVGGITRAVYQQEPLNTVWTICGGDLVGMTYYPDQKIYGWHPHDLNATILDVAVIPSPDGDRDELWLLVEYGSRNFICYMTRFYEDDMVAEEYIAMDYAVSYSGVATDTVTGLWHLEGETVKVMVDGRAHPDLVVSGGQVTLANNRTGEVINVGIGNTWIVETQDFEAGAQDGVAHGKTRRITGFKARVLNTLGLYYGADATTYDEYDFNQGQAYDESTALYSGNTDFLRFPSGYNDEAILYLWHDGVFPATICALMPDIVTYDRG